MMFLATTHFGFFHGLSLLRCFSLGSYIIDICLRARFFLVAHWSFLLRTAMSHLFLSTLSFLFYTKNKIPFFQD